MYVSYSSTDNWETYSPSSVSMWLMTISNMCVYLCMCVCMCARVCMHAQIHVNIRQYIWCLLTLVNFVTGGQTHTKWSLF